MQEKIGRGFRVIVPFGKKKYYTAIVSKVHDNSPGEFSIKEIHSIIDTAPIVTEEQLSLWEWISFYYLCSPGDVFKAALPTPMMPTESRQGFTSKKEAHLKIAPLIDEESILNTIGSAQKQYALFKEIQQFLNDSKKESISKKEIKDLSHYTPSVLSGLIKKGILISFSVEMSRLKQEAVPTRIPYPLSAAQQETLLTVQNCFSDKQTVLLHGVTSSGKTEIYIHLMNQYIEEGKQVLYLLPEIALTTQLTHRLQAVFGNKIGIYHSAINELERTEIWLKMISDTPYKIILGVRSSLFLPFQHLGLVIIDEEHETSYKQQEPAPRYHARDTAIMLAHFSGAKTLLGSATPSIETYYNAQKGKYGFAILTERFETVASPSIRLINTKDLRRRKKMKSILAPALMDEIHNALDNKEQVILFRNRRGFATLIECTACGWIPKCKHCDVSLTYHKRVNRLICHYCNTSYFLPTECPSCHQGELKPIGTGTEQLEEEVAQLFPQAVVARMDSDTTRSANSFEEIIDAFQENRIQILVGTQMISKGLDFKNVRIVGIIAADALLSYPDFRSFERGFQLITQAAGRAGRREKQGTVIIQTADPEQPIFRFVTRNDYEGFYNSQLSERQLFKYPPFTRLISIVLRHRDEEKLVSGAMVFSQILKQAFTTAVLGPNKPVVSRIQQYNIREILLKIDSQHSPTKVRELIKSSELHFRKNKSFKDILLYYNVDGI